MSDINSALEKYLLQRAGGQPADTAALLDHIPDGLVLTDPSSKILWANASYCTMTGYPMERLVGNSPRMLRSASTRGDSIEALWESLNASGRAETPIMDTRADGSEFHAWLSVVRVELGVPSSTGYLGIMRDISLEVADRARLKAAVEQAAEARNVTIVAMATMAEQRDGTTGRHLQRVEAYCLSMTRWLCENAPGSLPPAARDPELVARCATLHDIGKVGIPDVILTKPGRLDPEEQEVMRRHPIIGAEILEATLSYQPDSGFLQLARDVVLYHHEAYDGSGYPYGLAGDQIPVVAQLTTVADVLDALTSERPYKAAHSLDESIRWIEQRRGGLFDPFVVDAMLAVRDEVAQAHSRLRDARPTSSSPISRRQLGAPSVSDTIEIAPSLTEERHSAAPQRVATGDGIEVVLRAVLDARLTGELGIPHGAHRARVDIAQGQILWVDGTGSSPTLQKRLIEAGLLSPAELERAVSECRRTGQWLTHVLLGSHGIGEPALRELVLQHVAQKLAVLLHDPASGGATFSTRPCVRTSFAFELDELLAVQGLVDVGGLQ